jgi:hypothetical protein
MCTFSIYRPDRALCKGYGLYAATSSLLLPLALGDPFSSAFLDCVPHKESFWILSVLHHVDSFPDMRKFWPLGLHLGDSFSNMRTSAVVTQYTTTSSKVCVKLCVSSWLPTCKLR